MVAGSARGIDAFEEACVVRLAHLRAYLTARLETARVLLVAKAPGYQGARFSGVAMTCERTITGWKLWITAEDVLGAGMAGRRTSHELACRSAASRRSGFCEPTATIVWEGLMLRGASRQVVLWNAFPFHPHPPGRPLQNRRPTDAEVDDHRQVMNALREMFPNVPLVAVGNTSRDCLARQGVEALHIRHPANGGAQEFRAGLTEILHQPHLHEI